MERFIAGCRNIWLAITKYEKSRTTCEMCSKRKRKYSFYFCLAKENDLFTASTNKQTSVCPSCWEEIANQFEGLSGNIRTRLVSNNIDIHKKLNLFNIKKR